MKFEYKGYILTLCPSTDINKRYIFTISNPTVLLGSFIRYDIEDAKKIFIQNVDNHLQVQINELISQREEISAELGRISNLSSELKEL